MPTLFQDSVKLIHKGARELGLGPSFGWEFLYSPSFCLSERSRLWFIGINPGGTGGEAMACFEHGNAYYGNERWSPDGEVLRGQVKDFFERLACAMGNSRLNGKGLLNKTLTSNFCPFNSDTWRTFPDAKRRKAVEVSRELWRRILGQLSPRVIICMGGVPFREFRRLYREKDYEFSKERSMAAGWGDVHFRLVDCRNNQRLTTIIYLPHFSQIKLMRHAKSRPHVDRLCLTIAESLRRP